MATAIEYALVAALIAVVVITILQAAPGLLHTDRSAPPGLRPAITEPARP